VLEWDRRARAEQKSKGETLVSERKDEPQFPLRPYRSSAFGRKRLLWRPPAVLGAARSLREGGQPADQDVN
jgi:hypothetical protein